MKIKTTYALKTVNRQVTFIFNKTFRKRSYNQRVGCL